MSRQMEGKAETKKKAEMEEKRPQKDHAVGGKGSDRRFVRRVVQREHVFARGVLEHGSRVSEM